MKALNVFYACDDHYAPYTGISMHSLFENNKALEHIRVWVAADKVSQENKEKLLQQAERYGRDVVIVDAEAILQEIEGMGLQNYRNSHTTNFRLFFPKIIAPDVDRLLYIDSDTLILSSLQPLLELDMQGKVAAVVRDSLTFRYKQLIGFAPKDMYFDVARWKEEDISGQMQRHVSEGRAKYSNPDQDILNIILQEKCLILSPQYNFQPIHRAYSDSCYFGVYPSENYYSVEELEQARREPVILHCYRFLGAFPWHKRNLHPDTPLFDEYRQSSLWRDLAKPKTPGGLMFRIERMLYRVLPRRLFLRLFFAISYRSAKRHDAKLRKQ